MTITTKTTRTEMKEFLKANFKFLKDKNLAERVSYTLKAKDDKVTKKDLVDLVKEVSKVVDELIEKKETPETAEKVEPKAENSVKKLNKGVSKKQKSMENSSEKSENSEETVEESKEEPKSEEKSTKKINKKKTTPKKEEEPLEATVSNFPETLEVDGVTYKLAPDIQNMESLYKALEKDEEIVFAFYYNKKMLKMAPYFFDMLGHPKSFENDLDLATTIYVSEEMRIAYHLSRYTEACYNTLPEDLEELDGVRYAGTMQFQIYRAVETKTV